MRKIYYVGMFISTLFMTTSCLNKEKAKEKIQAVKEKVVEKKKSEKSGDLSLTSAQSKALNKENPWFARDFRMELTVELAGGVNNVEIQKSGNVVYYHVWNNSGGGEKLFVIDGEEIKSYMISTKNKVAQLQRTYKDDLYAVFCKSIGEPNGIIHKAEKGNKKKTKSEDAIVESKKRESVDVKDERWNGFDCEKITRVTETESDLSTGMKALGSILGNKDKMDGMMKELKKLKQTDIVWLDKESGAVVHREFKMEGGGDMGKLAQQTRPLPTVKTLTFSPDASLIPNSLEDYKLVE